MVDDIQGQEGASSTRLVRAARLVTSLEVIENGCVAVAGDRIAAVGAWPEVRRSFSGPVWDLGEVTLAPGLVNAHAHLELSGLGGRTVLGQGFEAWVRSLVALGPIEPDVAALRRALDEAKAGGTAGFGDVATRHPELVAAELASAGLEHVVFVERIGFGPVSPMPEGAGLSQAGHALYSTSPETMRQAKAWCAARGLPFTLHLAEHREEVDFLAGAGGSFDDLVRQRLVPRDFAPPGLSPTAYADRLGLLGAATLAVHCVYLDDEDIDVLARRGATVCLCPRSNEAIGVGRAPYERLIRAGVPVCLGTDSVASLPAGADTGLWAEARHLSLHSSTRLGLVEMVRLTSTCPARVLGLDSLGDIRVGRLARFAIVPEDLARD